MMEMMHLDRENGCIHFFFLLSQIVEPRDDFRSHH